MSDLKLLAISGSLREASTNTMLLREGVKSFGPASVQFGDLNLPLYSGDIEAEGIPEAVQTLAAQMAAADAILISCPEYNKGISGVLKNALDWVSRVPDSVLRGKPVVLMAAAAGRAGGETGHYMTRQCLTALGAAVLATPPVLVAASFDEFTDDGALKTESYQQALDAATATLRRVASRG